MPRIIHHQAGKKKDEEVIELEIPLLELLRSARQRHRQLAAHLGGLLLKSRADLSQLRY